MLARQMLLERQKVAEMGASLTDEMDQIESAITALDPHAKTLSVMGFLVRCDEAAWRFLGLSLAVGALLLAMALGPHRIGDYFTAVLGDVPIVVVRNQDGSIAGRNFFRSYG